MQLTLRIILAGVLLWAATAKLRHPRALLAAVGEHGVPSSARQAMMLTAAARVTPTQCFLFMSYS